MTDASDPLPCQPTGANRMKPMTPKSVARLLRTAMTTAQLATLINDLLSAEADPRFPDSMLEHADALHDALCDVAPEAAEMAMTTA